MPFWKTVNTRLKAHKLAASRGGGQEVGGKTILADALVENYDDLRAEYDELDSDEQTQFLGILGEKLKSSFENGAMELEM